MAPVASAVVVTTASGRLLGVTPRAGAVVSSAGPGPAAHARSNALAVNGGPGSLGYHGGVVLHTTRPYLIFWDPSGQIDAPTRALFSRYLSDVATDSAGSDQVFSDHEPGDDVFGVTRQYSDATGYAASGETYLAADQDIADTQPYPAPTGGCTSIDATATPTCLTDAQLQAELQRLIAAGGLPTGTGPGAPVYFMLTPATVNVCVAAGECADNDFCAYHGGWSQDGTQVIYAAIPLVDAIKDCQADSDSSTPLQEPNGIPADVAVDNLSHEYNESISDPDLDAWYDSFSGNEEADLCQEYGATRDPVAGVNPHAYAPALGGSAVAGNLFDQQINGDPYYTQSEWSNGAGDCELEAGGPVIPGFNVPPTIQSGVPTAFDPMPVSGTISSTTWSFGDGTSAFSATAPTVQFHTYAAPGTYTVSLREVDSLGDAGTRTQTVTVPRPPVASFTQSTSLAGTFVTRVQFDGSASSDPQPGAHIVSYRWDFGDNLTSSGPSAASYYYLPGNYNVTLTVISSDGLSATATRPIRVEAVPGVRLVWENAYSVAGVPERFDGAPNPPGQNRAVTYHWDFGDGAKGSGPHVTHTFRQPGAYWVSLTLTTPDGLSNTNTRRLTVKPVEAITKASAKPAGAHAVLLKASVNGPGTLVLAGHRYTLAKSGSVSRVLALTARQRRALQAHHVLHLRLPVRFHPLVGRAVGTTAQVNITS